MTARPLVSICIPVFNGLPFLKEVMETALAQDYDNYEVVVSLDPSSDGSTEFCQALADPRLRIVTNPRPGLFPNLNNAIRESRGLLVQIMGQDDRMAPGYIASQVAEFERWGDLAMVVGRDCRIDENGTVGEVSRSSDDHEPMSLPLFMWRSAHYGSMAANISCVMVARSALAEVGLFDESYRFAGDVEFYNRIATVGRISYVKESHVFIRSHRRQASRSVAANLVYMREEKRIYDGFWKSALASEALYAEVIKFRKKTRGAYHSGPRFTG
jgi:glycosyltransferase involved in cell wall biosynthesis